MTRFTDSPRFNRFVADGRLPFREVRGILRLEHRRMI
jgi:hypothetical protein